MRPFWSATAVLGLAASLAVGDAMAQTFPSKVVRLVVPFAAGGSNDVVARAMAQPLSKALGQSVVVENRPGANTIIGTEAVARSPADGHTLLIVGFTFLSNAALRPKLPYDPIKDFTGVTRLGTQPFVISVHPSVPAKSIKELIAVARARPGQLAYAVPGYGSAQHLSGELLKIQEKIDMNVVVFQGGGPATIATLGGHASVLISTVAPIVQHIPAGKLRALAVTSPERSELLKDVPTMIELGYRDFDFTGAMGVFVHSATPREAIERLNAEVIRVLQIPEVKNGMMRDGFVVSPLGPAEYAAFSRRKMEQIGKIAVAAKLKAD
jgi:tripartite-type tricarboxylate transporter receptor subunit TctC